MDVIAQTIELNYEPSIAIKFIKSNAVLTLGFQFSERVDHILDVSVDIIVIGRLDLYFTPFYSLSQVLFQKFDYKSTVVGFGAQFDLMAANVFGKV